MRTFILFSLLLSLSAYSSVVGVSSHPLNEEARVISAEMAGYMSQRKEVGMGVRYTQEVAPEKLFDIAVAGATEARGLTAGTGLDMQLLKEELYQPRVSIKPFYQYQKFDNVRSNILGAAPMVRKGVAINSTEFFPFLALPMGMKIDSESDKFVYYSSLSFGASMPFPGTETEKFLLTVEGNKNLGASSDYIGALVSWVWK